MSSVLLAAATTANALIDYSDYSVFTSASSNQVNTIKIGATTDTELVITANTTATGDDTTGSDDEDGVTVPASIVAGTSGSLTINVTNSSGATVYLNVWIDFNRNGVLTDSGEQVASNTTIATGTSAANKTVNFTVPATASIGTAGVRVRLTSTSTPGSTGLVGNGEVEDYVMTIACPTVTLSPTTLTTPTVGTAYSQTISASGSSTTFTYAVTSGTLPAGLSLSTAGVLSGTPTSSAAATFTVKATGANTCFGSQSYTVTPVCPTVSLSPSTIPDASVGTSFSQTFTSSGGTSSYSYAVTSGTLPSGLSLSSAGVLSGTPTTSNGTGTSITIQSTDANGCTGSQSYTLQVCPAITISPTTLPATSVNAPYSQSVSASSGATPYTYAIASGSLPSGLTLNTGTGLISGTVTSTTAATFTISATDANGCVASRSYTLTPPTTDYGDFASFGSVSSTYNSNLKLGAVIDTESASTTNSTATGDDSTGADDEDGVTLPAYILLSTSTSMTVNVTNTTGATAYLNAWIDYNNNGVLTDSGEQVATNTTIATGTSGANRTVTFTVPATATQTTVGVRVRLTSTSTPGSTGASGNGEVEDYVVSVLPASDFGDDSAFGIAGSTTSTSLRMGAQVDSESSGLGNAAATGDDTTGVDDEDGVTLPSSVIQGQSGVSVTVNVTNSTGADAYLNGWIDFNNNGVLTDAGEQIVVNDVVSTGTSSASRSYTFTVPASAASGAIGVRFRLTSTASPGDSGISGTGEVEDYALTVVPASDHGDFSLFADASSYNSSNLGIGDLEDTEITPVTNLAATGDDITNISDEDGVTLQAILVQGQAGVAVTVKLNNTSGAPAYLNGWLDFNNNGSLTDADDQVITDIVVDDGTVGDYQTFYFDVPSTASLGSVGARFRLTSTASPGPTGASGYGEVEDYTTTIVAPSSNFRDYFYTIRNANGHFYLDEISVYNPNSSSPTVSVNPGILDLNTASPGFNTSSTDAMMNGLALDWLNRRFYWLATSTGSSGYNANLYTANYDNVSKTWNYQLVTGSTLSNIALNSGTPVSGSASSGAFPRAAYYDGEYYAGGQLSNNVAVWHLNPNGTSLASPAITDYTTFFHLSQTFNGGDFVIRPQDGLLVTSTVISNANTLFNQYISDGTNASGSAATTANIDSQIPYSSNSSVQIAGVGGVSRLYALGSTGTNIYRIDNYDTSSPKGVKVGPLPTATYTDLSEGISSSVTSLGVKGIVYNDANGLSDGIISGTGTNAGGTLYAMLVDSSGNLVDSFPVKSDGTFILGGASASTTYKVVLSTSYGSLGSTAPAAALPNGWLNAGEFLGSGAGSDGTVDGKLTVAVGSTGVVNATFGLSQTLSIGDTVWNDANNNGQLDNGESGIGSVTVQLWSPGTDNAIGGTGGAADTLLSTTTTDGTGAYSFAGLVAGKYFLTVTPPTMYSFASSTVAGDNGVDYDNNGSQPGGRATTVYSPIVTLAQATEPGTTGGGNYEYTIDFGLLTAYDYGDYSSFGTAGSALVSNLFIGAQTDAEYSAVTNTTATGDDLSGVDDEDGVTLPAVFYQGSSATLTVNVTNTSGATAFLNAWVDFNGNGVLTDSGEQVASNTIIANGTNAASRSITFTVPSTVLPGTVGVRVRLTSTSSPGPTGVVGNGEVEDNTLTIKGYGNLYDPDIIQFGLFVTDGTFSMSNSASGVYGGTGIASGVSLNISDGGLANFVMIHPPQTGGFGNADTLPSTGGSTISPVLTDLSTQRTQAYNLSTAVAAMTATQTFGAMTNSFTITSGGTHNVISMTSLKLSGGSMLTLQGGPNDYFFINVTTEFTFTGSSGMILSGGVNPQHVIVNLLPGAKALNLTGGSAAYSGTFLAVQSGTATTLTGGSIVTGSVYARDVTLTGGSLINGSAFDNGTAFDMGDYSGFLSAGSVMNSALTIGSLIDAESVLIDNSTATGDDTTGTDDEEGVTVPASIVRGASGSLTVNVSNSSGGTAYLNAWIDFNRNGVLTDSGEQIATNTAVTTGTSGSNLTVNFTVPTAAVLGATGVRVRLTSTSSPGATGNSGIGEVEDYTTTISCLPVAISPTTLPSATVGTAYSTTVTASGGTAPYSFSVSSGTLPTWATLTSAGVLSGTPNSATSSTFTIQATDANGCASTQSYTFTPVCPTVTIGQTSLSAATVGTAYSQTITASGGISPYTYTVSSGTLPTWATLSSAGVLSGTPNSTTAATFTVKATDANGCAGTQSYTLTPVCPTITIGQSSLPQGTVGTAYSTTLSATGGTSPYGTWSVISGTLPAGLTLAASTGIISGTPTSSASPSTTITVRVNDTYGCQGTKSMTLQICPVITLSPATLPTATVGTAFSQTITSSGGIAPYSYTVSSGALPSWATLSSTGVLSGTPTSTTSATFTVKATDANGCAGTASYTLTPVCPTITIGQSALPQGTVGTAYSTTLSATGGTAPYGTWTITSGTLPAGLTLNASTGVISGTPTATASPATTLTVRVNDTYGCQGSKSVTLQICPVITLSPATPATGMVGTAYSQTFTGSGGTSPYTFAVASGTLPAGLTLNSTSGVVSGTPTTQISSNVTMRATDANGCAGTLAVTFAMSCPVITVTPATLPVGTVGTAYSQTLTASGGSSSYTYTVSSGAMPSGLSLNTSTGVISGTPLAGNGAGSTFTISATDSFNCAGTKTYTLQVCPVVTLQPSSLTTPTVGTAYSQTITSVNGASPFTYSISSGALPSWATLSSSGVLSGTPSSTTSATFTVKSTDANGCPGTMSYTITPVCPTVSITQSSLPKGTVGTAYSTTLTATGGTSPYSSWTITSGTLPAGLTLNASTGVISGTPTASASPATTLTLRVNDTYGCQGSKSITFQVCPAATISPSTLPNGTINSAYSQTISASGGVTPYVFAVSSGTLPTGLTLNTSTGVISGTPTSVTSTTFVISATDANGCAVTQSYTVAPAPDTDYGDYSLFGNVGSRMNSTLRIGATTDAEASATTNTTATGDDVTGIDDEDGVTIASSITQGAAASMTVSVTNTSGASAFLNVWIDFNGNGSLTDSGEQIATNTVITTGTTDSVRTINFFTPVNATLGTAGVRTRLTSTSSPGATGTSGNGEVEDFVTTITAPTTDFGDFSLFADASSTGSTSLRLGSQVDLEGTSTLNAAATGDDITNQDDEDGVTFPSMTAGQPITLPVTVTNTTGAAAYLNAWIDFNNNGVLTDAGEQIGTNVSVATGLTNSTVNLNFTVPTNAVTAAATIGTRFRLTSVTSPGSTGAAGTGEVEDHGVTILAPLTDFGDFSGAPTVSNTASTNLRLGALVDTEYAATTDATATGDDITGVDDEDGVTLPAMTAGAPATIPITATNATGSPAYLNVWIDYNNNGVFTDSGEQIATNTAVPTGTSNGAYNLNITVPATAVTGTNLGVRARVSTDISPGSTGAGGVGEVEDYVVNIALPTTDFGDYSLFTLASSTANSTLRLGALTDTEYNATTNAAATGDDITGSDDEDGVTLPSMIAGGPATIPVVVTNTSGSAAYLNIWIDFNGNGVLTDSGEQIITNTAVATGTSNSTQNLNITVPATTLTGVNLGVRTMLTTSAAPSSTGYVGTGEIEDYVVNITAPTTDFGDFSGFADASQGVSPSLQMGASVDAEYASTRNSTATGDDTTGIDDEDGVTLPSMTAGQTVTIPVVITNSTGALGYLNAWIDFNNNGVLTDSGEQIATNVNVATGSSNTTFNINVNVPTTAVTGTNVGARFRLSAPTSPGATGANAAVGEIEDYVINIAAPTLDYSDFSGFSNAASTASTTLRMGTLVDTEYNPTVNATATGDDNTGSDDEDGVTMPSLSAGVAATIPVVVTNTSGATAYLNAWIDYNNNGVLTDSGEQIATNTIITTGTSGATKNISITVPNTATTGTNLGVRFRLTSVASPGSTGTVGTGEVEDYVVNIVSPTTDFGDWSGAADASNTLVSSLKLGSLIDGEFSSTKNATATGDDITYLADEDGVALPAMTAGGSYTIPVLVTNTSGATAYLNAWIDYNNNGVFTDTGEQIASNVSISTGSSGVTQNVNVTVPATAVTGTALGARFRLTSTSTPGSTGSGGGNGEVEDYVTTISVPTTDFGDFSKFASASSTMNSNLRLGALEDTEFTATTNTTATGDDITNQADEDGVTMPALTAGAPATIPVVVTNNTGSAAYLNAWIDYNNNGSLTDSGEQVATNVSIPTGTSGATQNLSITVPASATTGTSLGVRFRLTSVSTPGATGAAGSGEVEDYVASITAPPLDYGDLSTVADAASAALSGLRLGALIDTEYVSTRNATATGDDITNLADEDGVALPSMTAGAPATIPVVVTNTTGSAAYLNVWIDYNNNASFADSGEQIATNVSIPTGTSSATQNISITVPANATTGSNVGVRVRLTDVANPGTTGTIGNGEVEDYVTVIAVPTTDFGDWNGALDASSIASSNLRMGALADTEYVSTRNSTATGDDITNLADEDGVTLPSQTPGTAGSATVVVTNNSGATGYLNAWIDYNNNGSFSDSGEQIATNTAIATGTNGVTQTVNFIVPVTAIPGQRGARFRFTSTQNPTPVGASGVGEVEDYLVTMTCLPIAVSPGTLTTPTVGTAYSQSVSASGSQGTPYTYSIGSGALPAGLTLSSAGVISGTPTSSAAATFTVVATDIYSCTGATSYTVTPACPTVTVTPSTLPSGTVGTAYSQTISASGGTASYTYSVSSGTLPTGLSLNASTGVISGTPSGSNGAGVSLTLKATDTYGCVGTRTVTLIICPVVTLTPATLPAPVVGTAYSQTLAGSGGATPYTFTLASGTLPAWATLSSSGVLSGTPTSTTAATFSVKATDANGCSGTLSYTVTPVCPTISITQSALPQGTIGTAYSTTLSATGGTAPYGSWTITSGALPAGLTLSSAGVISGTPTATASPATTITVRTTDTYGCQGSKSITLQICPVVTLAPTTLTTPVVGTAYSQTITASGGTASYTYTLASGTLPTWATLSSTGVISGTPSSTTAATFTVKATDANGCAGTQSYTLTPNCPAISITPATPAQSIVGSAYSQTLTASGGTAPYASWTVTSGTLPAGLTLNASTGVISGTPTTSNGTGVSVTVRATDNFGCQGSQVILLQVCPVITLSPATPATPTVSTAYSQTFTASGGATPYTYTVSGGTLPTWATLSSAGVLSGTPDSPNSATFTVKATDANGCPGTQSYTITPVCPTLSISPTTAATGTVGTAYSQTLSGSGGTGPYTAWTVTSGSLPAGLSLSASTGVISGTPTASTGAAVSFIVRTTDARGCQATATISLKICPVISLTPTTMATATAGASYTQTISASGGVTPYVFAVSSGALPAGLTLNSSTGVVSGTPTNTTAASFTISATDANGCPGTRSYTMTPACQTITVSPSTLPAATVNTAYSQTVSSTGGLGTVTYSISSGALPAGLSLNSSTGVISGTPTSTSAATFTVRATDGNACTGTLSYTVTPACPVITVTPATLTTGGVGVAYSQTMTASGGIAPYGSWTVTSGTLPAGLSLNSTTGVISGTPTTSNGAGVNVTLRATDANGCQGSVVASIKICPVITQSPATFAAPVVGTAWSQTISGSGGVSPYTFTLVSGALPAGLTLSSSGTISGTATSTTSATFTLKATASDGCSGTASYTITPACPTLSITPNGPLPLAYLGTSYSQTVTASGGTAPYTYALQSGDLPSGVLLSSGGVVSGTPGAKGTFPVNVKVTDTYGCSQTFSLSIQVLTLSIGNLVFEDSNNNGVKDTGEPGVAGATVQLFTTGDDNAIGGSGTAADTQVGADFTTDSTGAYLFNSLPSGNYYVKVTPPADYLYTGGTPDTADDNVDNNNDGAQPGGAGTPVFSPVVNLSGAAESMTDGDTDPNTNLTVDFGLWSSVAVGNFIFLDINGDGFRNEGESLGNIYVELYAQGATPGVDTPVSVGTSGCSCKGRYYLDGLNPGIYFLHIPASQFSAGMPLQGLQPMSSVVAGDDDVGQDLIFNNNPAVNGASTAAFTLRPGFCPVGAAESGAEGNTDDAIDARVDLTRDLGIVAPAGTGFAASESIRRYIVTGGFVASVLPGASTFATWSQDSGIGGPADDPDEDGLSNLLEYALGTDPASPLQPNRFALTHDSTGSLTALLTVPTATHDDLIISLETLTDLTQSGKATSWKKLSMASTTTINADGTLTRAYGTLEKLLVFKGLDGGYIRLHVDLDANRDGVPEATVTSAIQGWGRQSFATGSRTFSMPLLNAAFFTGRAVSVSSNEVMLPAIITLPAGSLYLEALDGPLAGQRFEIDATASSGNTVVLQGSQDFSGLAGAHICIRLHHTLADLLPPAAFSSEDRVLFFDPAAGNYTTCTNTSGSWISDILSMNARPFAAHEAAMVQIRGAGAVLMFTGEVRQTSLATALVSGTQLIAPGWPVVTQAPVNGLSSGLTPDSADRLRIWDGDTTPSATDYTGYYLDGTTNPPAWLPQTAPAPDANLFPFHGYFLIRTAPGLLKQAQPW